MPAKVFCRKFQQELEGLVTPPFPGPRGQDIFNNISLKAWQEWQVHQLRLINEKQLSMINADHRKFLQEEMDKFFSNQDFATASGYVEAGAEKNPDKS